MIDLHSHTNFSDGELSPEDLVALAAQNGVRTLAITDHDTIAGLERGTAAARVHGLELVAGIEISAHEGSKEFHVLGHAVDSAFPELRQLDARLGRLRRERMQAMLDKLAALGVFIPMEAVEGVAQGAHLGRPHLARALVQAGRCTSTQEAFQQYLGDGRAAHVSASRITVPAAIALIHRAGGTASLAHPGMSRLEEPELRAFAEAGLDALEVFHPEHVPSQRDKLSRWTARFGLAESAGSDYHGPKVSPGKHPGMESLSPAAWAKLRARAPPRSFDSRGRDHYGPPR